MRLKVPLFVITVVFNAGVATAAERCLVEDVPCGPRARTESTRDYCDRIVKAREAGNPGYGNAYCTASKHSPEYIENYNLGYVEKKYRPQSPQFAGLHGVESTIGPVDTMKYVDPFARVNKQVADNIQRLNELDQQLQACTDPMQAMELRRVMQQIRGLQLVLAPVAATNLGIGALGVGSGSRALIQELQARVPDRAVGRDLTVDGYRTLPRNNVVLLNRPGPLARFDFGRFRNYHGTSVGVEVLLQYVPRAGAQPVIVRGRVISDASSGRISVYDTQTGKVHQVRADDKGLALVGYKPNADWAPIHVGLGRHIASKPHVIVHLRHAPGGVSVVQGKLGTRDIAKKTYFTVTERGGQEHIFELDGYTEAYVAPQGRSPQQFITPSARVDTSGAVEPAAGAKVIPIQGYLKRD